MPVIFKRYCLFILALVGMITSTLAQASCGTTSCSINTDWNKHGVSRQGWSTDFRYSYSRADTLRSGTN